MLKESFSSDFQYSWLVAVIIAVAASTVSNFGMNLQKLAHNHRANKTGARAFVMFIWILGFVLLVAGALSDFAALGFGAQSIVAPLGSWTLVSNVVIAPFFLGEKLTRRDLIATMTIVAGCCVSVATASHKDEIYTSDQLFDLYTRPSFYAYFVIVAIVVVSMLMFVAYVERIESSRGTTSPQYLRYSRLHRFAYSCVAGLIGAQSVLFAKTAVELLTGTIVNHERIFLADWRTYPILVALIVSLTGQVYYMQCGLARWDALYCVPIFQSAWILLSVVGGGVFYNEFSQFDVLQSVLFPFGVALCIAGVYVLSQRDIESVRKGEERRRASSVLAGEVTPLLSANSSTQLAPLISSQHIAIPLQDPQAQIKTMITDQRHSVTFTKPGMGLILRPTLVQLVDVNDFANTRKAKAWVVEGVEAPASEGLDCRSSISIGDMLEEINGESVLSRWITHADAIRRITNAGWPLTLTFRHTQRSRLASWSPTSRPINPSAELTTQPAYATDSKELTGVTEVAGAHEPLATPAQSAGMMSRLRSRTQELPHGTMLISPPSRTMLMSPPSRTMLMSPPSRESSMLADKAAGLSASAAQKLCTAAQAIGLQLVDTELALSAVPASVSSLSAGQTSGQQPSAHMPVEFELYVTNAEDALSAAESISTSHHQLRYLTMDPLLSLFHMGGMIGPTAMDRDDRHDQHPLAGLVVRVLPPERKKWDVVGDVMEKMDAWKGDRRARAHTALA